MRPLPRPVDVVTFNAVGAMPTDRRPLGNAVLESAASHPSVDLLWGVECDDAAVREVLDPAVWWWRHRGAEHQDGLLVAGRRSRTQAHAARWLDGAPASPVNAPRPLLRVRVSVDGGAWSFTGAAMHLPRPEDGGQYAHDRMLGKSHVIGADLLAGDFNVGHDQVCEDYPGRTVMSAGVMHIVTKRSLWGGSPKPFDLLPGTKADDHSGLRAKVCKR